MSTTTSSTEARSRLTGSKELSIESKPVHPVAFHSAPERPFHKTKSIDWLNPLNCLGLLVVIGYFDYATGYQTSLLLFYLAPIIVGLRRVGFKFAVLMCALSSGVWLVSNMLAGKTYTDWFTPAWNTSVRLCIFLLVTSLVAGRGKLKRQVQQSSIALGEEILKRTRLEKEVLEASEREQQRIGQDLHDTLCQHLTATALAVKILARKLEAQSRPEAAEANRLVGMVGQGIEHTRMLARSLYPIELNSEGLVDGLRELAVNIRRGFSVNCELECSQLVSLATPEANLHLYRIAQEAINNAIRHGHAKNIALRLEARPGETVLTITDDGAGLPADAGTKGGLGFHMMNYRAGMTGGKLQITALPSHGTRVACIVPEAGRSSQ